MRLNLTRRADYGIRAVLALAGTGDPQLSARQIAEDQRIPPAYLPRIMADLVRTGLVEARAGRTGGYRLARPATAISLLEIVEAIEGDIRRKTCVLRGGPCQPTGVCAVHSVFAAAEDDLRGRLAAARLGELRDSD